MTHNYPVYAPHPVAYELRRRKYDGKLIKYKYSPDPERAMQWQIVRVRDRE